MRYFGGAKRAALAVMLSFCLLLAACRAPSTGAVGVLVDGEPWRGRPSADPPGARVFITVDGAVAAELPFDEAHVITVQTADGGENVVRLTGDAVYMERANCENQDCVGMGEITLENLELRVMGGFIICLPHKVSVEVRVP